MAVEMQLPAVLLLTFLFSFSNAFIPGCINGLLIEPFEVYGSGSGSGSGLEDDAASNGGVVELCFDDYNAKLCTDDVSSSLLSSFASAICNQVGFSHLGATYVEISAAAYSYDSVVYASACGVSQELELLCPDVAVPLLECSTVLGVTCQEIDHHPDIIVQPQNQTNVMTGTNVTFSVTALGGDMLSYTWYKDGEYVYDDERVQGSDSPELHIYNVAKIHEGSYQCAVSSEQGATTSNVAVLTVAPSVGCTLATCFMSESISSDDNGLCYCSVTCAPYCCSNYNEVCVDDNCIDGSVRFEEDIPGSGISSDLLNEVPMSGVVEMCVNRMWTKVCLDSGSSYPLLSVTAAVCNQLGFSMYGATNTVLIPPVTVDSTYIDVSVCGVTEFNYLICDHESLYSGECSNLLTVYCQADVTQSDCEDMAVRVQPGGSGLLEVCLNSAWGTVCATDTSQWSPLSAGLACKQSGLSSEDARPLYFGRGSGPVFFQGVDCHKEATGLQDCQFGYLSDIDTCYDHKYDAGVDCAQPEIRFESAFLYGQENTGFLGITVILTNPPEQITATVTVSAEDQTATGGSDYTFQATNLVFTELITKVTLSITIIDDGTIEPDETFLLSLELVDTNFPTLTVSEQTATVLIINDDFATEPACEPNAIQLIGEGAAALQAGRVEVCLEGNWTTVCDQSWDYRDASVACRQLGLPWGGAVVRGIESGYFGQGTSPILLQGLECEGSEPSLLLCPRGGTGASCDHSQDAGIQCSEGIMDCQSGVNVVCTVEGVLTEVNKLDIVGDSQLNCIEELSQESMNFIKEVSFIDSSISADIVGELSPGALLFATSIGIIPGIDDSGCTLDVDLNYGDPAVVLEEMGVGRLQFMYTGLDGLITSVMLSLEDIREFVLSGGSGFDIDDQPQLPAQTACSLQHLLYQMSSSPYLVGSCSSASADVGQLQDSTFTFTV